MMSCLTFILGKKLRIPSRTALCWIQMKIELKSTVLSSTQFIPSTLMLMHYFRQKVTCRMASKLFSTITSVVPNRMLIMLPYFLLHFFRTLSG